VKIGLLTQWYEPEPGPAALPSSLARGLAARGHDVQVLTGFPNYPSGRVAEGYQQRRRTDEVLGGVRVRRVALYPSHDASAAKRVVNYASFAASAFMSGLDVLSDRDALWVNYSPVTVGGPMLVLRRRHDTPVVMHVLDLWPDTVTASGLGGRSAGWLEAPLTRWCDRLYGSADRVAYISPGVGDVLHARGVPREKLAYAPMWADEAVNTFRPVGDDRGWGLGRHTLALVYAGTLGGAQDLSTFIRACAQIRDLDVRCLIAGSGTHEQDLVRLATEVGADNVRFLGRLTPEEVSDLSAAADVHYVGLNDHPLAELTMPSKVQAILACGRPIIGSLVGDAAAVVARSGGWTSRPGDVGALAENIRAAASSGRPALEPLQRSARDLYEAEFAQGRGVDRIEELLMRAAGVRRRG
jgi:colanic acid biosynthesis glycosyl transferase WcaI